MTSSDSSFRDEEYRLKGVYSKRAVTRDRRLDSFFDRGNLFIIQDRERQILALLKQQGRGALEGQKLLEVGCGTGYWLREFIKWGARPENISGIDLRPEAIALAKPLCPSSVTLYCENATKLRFPDATFDLVIQSTVFSSILDEQTKKQVAREMLRVVKPDGAILWYDFFRDNPGNPDVRGIRKGEVRGLFPNCQVMFRQITLAPPLVRLLAPRSWLLCYFLTMLRVLNTHYLALIRPGG